MSPSHPKHKAVPKIREEAENKNHGNSRKNITNSKKKYQKQYPTIITLLLNIMQMKAQSYTQSVPHRPAQDLFSGGEKTITVA